MPEPATGLPLEVALEPDVDAAKLRHATSQLSSWTSSGSTCPPSRRRPGAAASTSAYAE